MNFVRRVLEVSRELDLAIANLRYALERLRDILGHLVAYGVQLQPDTLQSSATD